MYLAALCQDNTIEQSHIALFYGTCDKLLLQSLVRSLIFGDNKYSRCRLVEAMHNHCLGISLQGPLLGRADVNLATHREHTARLVDNYYRLILPQNFGLRSNNIQQWVGLYVEPL